MNENLTSISFFLICTAHLQPGEKTTKQNSPDIIPSETPLHSLKGISALLTRKDAEVKSIHKP